MQNALRDTERSALTHKTAAARSGFPEKNGLGFASNEEDTFEDALIGGGGRNRSYCFPKEPTEVSQYLAAGKI